MQKLVEMKNITKVFPGVRALDDVSFDLYSGETHVLMGENGAGKSTLMKVLNGTYTPTSGEILLDGEKVNIANQREALSRGISMIYQELNPIPHMTVAENIFLGREYKTKIGTVDYKRMNKETKEYLIQFGMENVSPKSHMVELSIAETQMIEIIKASSFNTKVLIMDEPTSSLTDREVEKLFETMNRLKETGVGIVYISHKMEEIMKVADRITVMRDGRYIGTRLAGEVDIPEIIKMMVNREIKSQFPYRAREYGEVALEGSNLSGEGFNNVNISIRAGEIVGMYGLIGAGRTETAEAMFGMRKLRSGTIKIKGEEKVIRHPQDAIKNKFILLSEDRKLKGLNLKASVGNNITICTLDKYIKFLSINKKKELADIKDSIQKLNVKTPSEKQLANYLSGGNQQKVVLAKSLLTEPEIMIFDEPTRGIDVNAKAEIYRMLLDLADQKKAIVFISSELPELMGITDRMIIMHEGLVTGELERKDYDQSKIMELAIADMKQSEGENEK
jgi:inositol transport system ATP-binding protein